MKLIRHLLLSFLCFFLLTSCFSVYADDDDYDEEEGGDSVLEPLNVTSSPSSASVKNVTATVTTTASSVSSPLVSTSRTTSTLSYSEGDSEEEESSEDEETEDKPNGKRIHVTRRPFEVEGESLSKLQKFMLSNVETMLKDAMPLFLRSGLETNVSASCAGSLLNMVSALRESKIWAFTMLDSSGKLPSGILEGTLTDLGAFDQCLAVESDGEGAGHFVGQYCLLDMRPAFEQNIPLGSQPPPGINVNDLVWDQTLQRFWSNNDLLAFRYGACIPSSCTRDDFDELVNYLTEPAGMESIVHSCQFGQDSKHVDIVQWIVIGFFAFMLTMTGVGTSIEFYLISKRRMESIESKRGLFHFLTRFSLHGNTKKLLATTGNPSGSPLRHLDGMRTISISWIILGHTYFYTDIIHYQHYRRLNRLYQVDDNPLLMWLSNFTFSVDTFFHISGVLLIYSSWKKMKLNEGKIDIIDFFVHRVWRIWPSYLTTIGLALILPLLGSGPLWPLSVDNTAQICRQSWLYNIFFVNNFQKPDQLCMLHTWFLSASMQFHVLGGFILYIIYKSPRAGITLCFILTALSSAASFAFAYINSIRTPSVIAYEVFAHDSEQKILQLYMMPYNHFGSYLSGIIVGYFLVEHKDRRLPKSINIFLWVVSLVVAVASLFGPFRAFQSIMPSLIESGLYYAFARSAWSWTIGWIIFACSTGRGGPVTAFLSWSFFNPLSNLSFLAYLVHPILMLFHTGRIRERIYFGHYELVNIFVSRLVFSFILAYMVHVLIEVPFSGLESYIFPKKSKKSSLSPEKFTVSTQRKGQVDSSGRRGSSSCCCCQKTCSISSVNRLHMNFRRNSNVQGMSFTKTDNSC